MSVRGSSWPEQLAEKWWGRVGSGEAQEVEWVGLYGGRER